ncbi:hypothetical protein MASR1M31_18750 [Porphyromonadaceae bacterium]
MEATTDNATQIAVNTVNTLFVFISYYLIIEILIFIQFKGNVSCTSDKRIIDELQFNWDEVREIEYEYILSSKPM